jgi:hypothetical protein
MEDNAQEKVPSEGEDFLAEYFDSKSITYERQKKITNLKGDGNHLYRIADFYIEDYGVYLEFFGLWSNPDFRLKYNNKRNVYKLNNIPCIYIYPDNLGYIDYIFKRRLLKALHTYNLKKKLLRYWWDFKILEEFKLHFIIAVICIYAILAHKLGTADTIALFVLLAAVIGSIGYSLKDIITKPK